MPRRAFTDMTDGDFPAMRPDGTGRARQRFDCYVALGDSFSAGTGAVPGLAWPDHLAAHLRASNRQLLYRNLAVEGARSKQVMAQVPAALQLEPDLITVVCGANDVLFSLRADVLSYARNLAAIFRSLERASTGVTILTATTPERWGHPELSPRLAERLQRGVQKINRATRELAAAYGITCVEIADHPGLAEAENFAADGLHPSEAGHALAALEFIGALDRTSEKSRANE
jgi:lysophospholipase L1-like esterase